MTDTEGSGGATSQRIAFAGRGILSVRIAALYANQAMAIAA